MVRLYSVGDRWMNWNGAMVERYWKGQIEVLGEKPVRVPFLSWSWYSFDILRNSFFCLFCFHYVMLLMLTPMQNNASAISTKTVYGYWTRNYLSGSESWVTGGIHSPKIHKFGQHSRFGLWSSDFPVNTAQKTLSV
jgi:UNC-50 family.